MLVVAGWLAAGAAVAAYPYLATLVLLAGRLAAAQRLAGRHAAGARRQTRGQRWYDGPQLLLAAPWHLVQSIPGTVMLVMWAAGLAVAGALLGYAGSLGLARALFLSGTLFAAALWLGPGGSRVRGPLGRVVRPVSARPVVWAVGTLLVVALGTGAGALATDRGVDWAPAQHAPFAGR